ncbi:MAG TPA: MobF family relaxase [Acidimicrobiia bacterium]|nr:MobF family relaxase [Acidimicrobiia bacterium]
MISIGKLRSPDYYLREVVDGEDYYLAPGEAPGRWRGGGAALLGLVGVVDEHDLTAVFVGRNPRSDGPLAETAPRLAGFDLTFSPPKSISLFWALSPEEDALRVVGCVERAMGEVERYLEREACRVRRGHAGLVSEPAGGFVAAAFLHRTSRLADPGLHVHYLVMNAAEGPDGRWTALDGRALYRERYTADALFQAALRHELARDFGVLFGEADRHGVAEIAGIDAKTRRAFSRRRIEIEAEMTHRGVTGGRAARIATLATRTAKSKAIPEDGLRRAWAERAAELGFSLDGVPRMPRIPALTVTDEALAEALTDERAAFGRADVVRAVATSATQGASLAQIDARTDAFLSSSHAVALVDGRWWTTPEMLALERHTIRLCLDGTGIGAGMADPAAVEAAIAGRPSLAGEQQAMIRRVTGSGNRLDVVVGPPGCGKTFALDAVREGYQASGYRVIGVALAARAARELQSGAGIDARTARSFQLDLDRGRDSLDARTAVVIDEAAMLGTRLFADLVARADRAGAKVIAVGDPKQLPAIEAGGLFSALLARVDAVRLAGNRRQRDPAERAALGALRAGRVNTALARLERNGNITVADNADLLREALVDDWYQAHATGRQAVMGALRRSDIADLNQRARERLLANGRLGPDVLTVDERSFAVGDRVLTRRNRYDLGVVNGDVGEITGASRSRIHLRLDDGREVSVPFSYAVEGHLDFAYARTIHQSQASTCDVEFLLGDDALVAELGYTGLSRARDHNRLYTVAARDPDHPGDPLVDVRHALGVSQAKTAAVDVAAGR